MLLGDSRIASIINKIAAPHSRIHMNAKNQFKNIIAEITLVQRLY